jgi:hypothetical protein
MAVPAVLLEVEIGIKVSELVLAAYTVVVVPPETFTVTRFCPYCGATLRLQFGVLHVAVMVVVPPVLAVTV